MHPKVQILMRIFAVEDDIIFSKMLRYILELDPMHEVSLFSNGKDLLKNLEDCLAVSSDKRCIVTIDYSLPDISGEELLKKIKRISPSIPVIVVSGQEDIKTAVQLLKSGAYDYLPKDTEVGDRLLNVIQHIKREWLLNEKIEILQQEVSEKYGFSAQVIGTSAAMKKVLDWVRKAAKTSINIVLVGETGTGKEVIAKTIHYQSDRKDQPFVAVNVAAIPTELIESELFGYEKGAFTGATTARIGKLEAAQKGTLFLDEIAEMPLHLQAKLLRVLQERELQRIGSNVTIPLDFRLITATHRNLEEEVKKGNFRQDLFYRIKGVTIELPPLRERQEDILMLAKFFMKEFCQENHVSLPRITPEAAQKLLQYAYPGNVRELKSIVELAVVMCNGETLTAEDVQLPQEAYHKKFEFVVSNPAVNAINFHLTLDEHIIRIIEAYLHHNKGDISATAQQLNMGRATIYRYLKKFGK
jgi:DNA-binding NtrC family response regulator